MSMPDKGWPIFFHEFRELQDGVPDVAGAGHNALNDARSILHAMKLRGVVGEARRRISCSRCVRADGCEDGRCQHGLNEECA
jgi:hypothetical protein